MYKKSPLTLFLAFACIHLSIAQEPAKIIYEDENDCLRYVADSENNYLPDFSYAGYQNGEVPLPELEVVKSIQPLEGDNTAHIQAVLDEMALIPLNEEGIRGALLLEAGNYEIHGTITIKESGIVLRGVGSGNDPDSNTILLGIGNTPSERDLIRMGDAPNVGWSGAVLGSYALITSPFVPAGSRSLEVSAPELFSPGNNVIIRHTSTKKWLESINYGDTGNDDPWSSGTIDIIYNRYIKDVDFEENKILLDAPIYDHFDLSLSQAYLYVLNKGGIKNNMGIENLRIDIQTEGPLTENHAKNAIKMIGVEDCWLKNVTALHFIYAAVDTRAASRVTVKDCRGLEPHSEITGGRRYNFAVGQLSNLILFENCHATEGRHSFVSNGTSSVSGIVFHNCTSKNDYASSEGHRRWSQGLLFDNITFTNTQTNKLIGLYNRGSFGTGHGWSTTNGVAWGIKVPIANKIILQKPPGRQNYAIGCQAVVTNINTFTHPIGYAELVNKTPLITSLYQKQLTQRLDNGVPPDAPAQLIARQIDGMIQLEWLDIASQEIGYSIEISTDIGQSFSEIAQNQADQTSYLHSDLSNINDQPIYRVSAIGNDCLSPYSNNAVVDVTTSLDSKPIPSLKVFPNPFRFKLTIHADSSVKQIKVFNSYGIEIENRQVAANIDGSEWPSGVYFLQITDASERKNVTKVVKL